MVTVKLSEASSMDRLQLSGGEITRSESVEVSLNWAIVRANDPNLLFTFEEKDSEELKSLEGNLLKTALRELRLETLEEIESTLLPKKAPSRGRPKSTTAKKTTTKSKKD